jgi:pimeloyl-ACP methyl ester carboxylesterase
MPAVFVHGNPESSAIWEGLVSHLHRRDVTAVSPPGFGAPVPEGFDASADGYLQWLIGEIERIDTPVDLVGHDWGGVHVLRLAMARPELIRSWTTDVAGTLDADYVWHDRAQVWQAPGEGERAIASMIGEPVEARAARLESLGLGQAAMPVSAAFNADMGRCILTLYRSAAQPAMKIWGQELAKAAMRPGLVIIPSEDHFTGGESLAQRSAARAGGRVEVLRGRGHWWMCEDPAQGADVLNRFFAALT